MDTEAGSLLDLSARGDAGVPEPVAREVIATEARAAMSNARAARKPVLHRFQSWQAARALTTYAEGIDFSYTPTGQFPCIRGSGRSFVCMYIKWAGRASFEAARANGLRPVAIYETSGVDYRGGRSAGANAARAFEAWCGANGYGGAPVYFTYDEDVLGLGNGGAAHDYALGWRDVIGVARCGAYGQNGLVGQLLDAGLIARQWVTYAWSGGGLDPRVTLYQNPNDISVCGVSADRDRAFQPSIGAVSESPTPPQPPQPPQSEEDKEMQAYERLAPGDDAAIPLPVGVKATIEISTDDSGRTAPGVPKGEAVRIAIGGPMSGAVTNQNGWHPLLPHPGDPGLGSDPFVGYLSNGSFVAASDGTGGTLVIENISPTRAQQLGVDATRFPVTNTVGVSVAYKLS